MEEQAASCQQSTNHDSYVLKLKRRITINAYIPCVYGIYIATYNIHIL